MDQPAEPGAAIRLKELQSRVHDKARVFRELDQLYEKHRQAQQHLSSFDDDQLAQSLQQFSQIWAQQN
jgi:hypothetical protein